MDIRKFYIVVEINNILAAWDPIGCQLVDVRWPYSEYIRYIPGIIYAYLSERSIDDYLVKLNLVEVFNAEFTEATNQASNQIVKLLSNVTSHEIKILFPDWSNYSFERNS